MTAMMRNAGTSKNLRKKWRSSSYEAMRRVLDHELPEHEKPEDGAHRGGKQDVDRGHVVVGVGFEAYAGDVDARGKPDDARDE